MNADELKALQAPLKDSYRQNPSKLIELTERYCVVLQTIRKAPPVTVSA